jgi:uncharacterized membrane protein
MMTTPATRLEAKPSAAPTYAVREVPFDAPYGWLAAGWRDMWRVPRVSLAYGAIFAVTGLVLAVGLTQVGLQSLILVLAGGFSSAPCSRPVSTRRAAWKRASP